MRFLLLLLLLTGAASTRCPAQFRLQPAPVWMDTRSGIPGSTLPVHAFAADQLIPAFAVELAFHKTTLLVFPAAIRAVDLGSRDLLGDKITGVENVLRLKANRIGFNETNLSVLTDDGRVYSFLINYNETPAALAIRVRPPSEPLSSEPPPAFVPAAETDRLAFTDRGLDQQTLREAFDRLLRQPGRRIAGARRPKVRACVTGLFVAGDLLLVRLRVENGADVPLTLRTPQFSRVDAGGRWRESAHQELDHAPVDVHPQPAPQLTSRTHRESVYALRRWVPMPRQRLRLRLEEATGGQPIVFSLSQRQLLRAKPLPLSESTGSHSVQNRTK